MQQNAGAIRHTFTYHPHFSQFAEHFALDIARHEQAPHMTMLTLSVPDLDDIDEDINGERRYIWHYHPLATITANLNEQDAADLRNPDTDVAINHIAATKGMKGSLAEVLIDNGIIDAIPYMHVDAEYDSDATQYAIHEMTEQFRNWVLAQRETAHA